jgi:hypothetical protein
MGLKSGRLSREGLPDLLLGKDLEEVTRAAGQSFVQFRIVLRQNRIEQRAGIIPSGWRGFAWPGF